MKPVNPVVLENPSWIDEIYGLATIARQSIDLIQCDLMHLDSALTELDHLLNIFQPPMNGKIRIQFECVDGMERPRPTVWRRARTTGQWMSSRVGAAYLPSRVKRSRDFLDNRHVVAELLAMAQELIEARGSLIMAVTNFKKAAAFRSKGAHPRIVRAMERLDFLKANADQYDRFDQPRESGSRGDEDR